MSSATTEEDSGTKIWRMRELIEKLLKYLNKFSILSIVGVKLLTVEVLQTASKTSEPLGKLVQKVLRLGQSQNFQQQREKDQRMSNTLLAQLDSPEPLLLEVRTQVSGKKGSAWKQVPTQPLGWMCSAQRH